MIARLLMLAFVFAASTTHAFDVTTCGQTVPPREKGILQTDLVCPSGVGVHLGNRASLDMNSFTIHATAGPAIACDGRRCTITSTGDSGDISGTSDVDCITMVPRGRMTLTNLEVHDCRVCVETNTLNAHAHGAIITASAVTVDTCAGPGIDARKVIANTVRVTNAHDIALWAEMALEGTEIEASHNTGVGIFAVRIKATNVIASANTMYGVESFSPMRISGGEMVGNGAYDVVGRTPSSRTSPAVAATTSMDRRAATSASARTTDQSPINFIDTIVESVVNARA